MTQTRRWLEARRRELAVRLASATALEGIGGVLLAFALGVALGRIGFYRETPTAVTLGWLIAGLVIVGATLLWRRRWRGIAVPRLAVAVEQAGGRRRGTILGVAAWDEPARSDLVRVADQRLVAWLDGDGDRSLAHVRAGVRRSVVGGLVTCVLGVSLFAVSGPAKPDGAVFWHPLRVLALTRAPVTLEVDRAVVPRGGSVVATISAAGNASVTFWEREPGRAWLARGVSLDQGGTAVVTLGPLTTDRFLRAENGRRSSRTIEVRVTLPALVDFLELRASYPPYLGRPDEPIDWGVGQIALPVGTAIRTEGRISVPVVDAAWVAGSDTVFLTPAGEHVSGTLRVVASARWRLVVSTAGEGEGEGRGGLDEQAPTLDVLAVADSAPTITVPLPGADTIAPVSLRQALMIDARDDHGVTRVQLTSWRASRLGHIDPAVTDTIPLPGDVTDRALLHWILDLNQRGFLPADTAYYFVSALDNAPRPQSARSDVYRLRLPSLAELRRETRLRSDQLREATDSLVRAQQELARELEDLAAERARNVGTDPMAFEAAEQASEAAERQDQAIQDAEALRAALEELSDAAWQSGLTDPEFYRQLAELQELLDRAVSDELREQLAELRKAVAELDASQVRAALERLAEAADRLRQQLERGRELFERAALEGEMTSLAQDTDELARQQDEWNALAQQRVDSALAAEETALANQGEQLAQEISDLSVRAAERDVDLSDPSAAGADAAQYMDQAARAAAEQASERAWQSGQAASSALQSAGEQLRERRDEVREEWRDEALAALDGALVETADLARQQQQLGEQMSRGEVGAEVRGAQGAVREGVDRVMERLQDAGGKNALISPRLGASLGAAGRRMESALEQLQRADPNGNRAAESAGEALDALNAVIYAMLQSRSAVEGAETGTGLQEALEKLAEMAEQQSGMNGETGSMLSLGEQGDMLMQQMQALAQRERRLAGSLDELAAEGEVGQAESLAEDARDIARTLEAGTLGRELLERQERLFRRLLDAGRSLQSEEEDEREERVSEQARPGEAREPGDLLPGEGPRYRYPTWQELRGLSPEVRRLVLDYFRRLNVRRP